MLPPESSVTPGISFLPRTRGPMPERNKKLPTRFACGNAPTGSGARELSKDLLIKMITSHEGHQGSPRLFPEFPVLGGRREELSPGRVQMNLHESKCTANNLT